ncbi:cyclopropane-fatty-acyl-phospholipid synthase family protein [Pinirhizobacter sp.]|jgi:cyclopropane-fatty-acyl-phospholipid synthase|uniref:cyclopropane-fatty-acyl-phospholipid synthase family protein n=1 Tax=Pinirhizobacter sp. TaxID=2950432 RepID=UPI002F3EF4DF
MSAIVIQGETAAMSVGQRFLRRRVLDSMAGMREGRLVITDALGRVEIGQPLQERPAIVVHLHVRDPRFYAAVATNGSIGAGEAWMENYWQCDDLVALIRLLVRNRNHLDAMETGLARLGGTAMRCWHAMRPNTRSGARRNIAAHYDLGNEFFDLFLSSDLMYSSALWEDDDDTLELASKRKLDRVCQWLDLKPGDNVMEIGTGWGGFAIHAARHYGCHVTTTTISKEQHALASERVARAGLGGQVSLLLEDFRDLTGRYDKLVSIEMIEAIGAANMDGYFSKIGALLRPRGRALLQAITIEDHRYAQALKSVDFIKRHVFPGSFIPSISAMMASKARSSELALVRQEDFGLSYARTLQAWRERFMAFLPQVRAMGYDERFVRMWEFYLSYCEGGFRERSIGVSHLLFEQA